MKKFYLSIFLVVIFQILNAQFYTIDMMEDDDNIEIPFEYEQGFIIIKVLLNGVLPLNFIFDTGAENTVLLEKQYAEIMGLPVNERIQIIGSDQSKITVGHISRRVRFKLLKGAMFKMDIVVLDEQNIDFNNIIGRDIDGILGGNMLLGSIVEINYKKKYIKFYRQSSFKKGKKYITEPIEIIRQRPFINSSISVDGEVDTDIKLLLDTGAAIHLMIDEKSHPDLIMPDTIIDSRIGEGIGGELAGFLGTISRISLFNHSFNDLPVYFQKIDSSLLVDESFRRTKNGIVGNLFLDRNTIIIDYASNQVHFKSNKKIRKPFRFNKSGIIVFAVGPNLEEYIIKYIVPGSPGDRAGLKQGDVIKRMNMIPHYFLEIGIINRILSGPKGRKVWLKVRREGEIKNFMFHLEEQKISKNEIDIIN